MLSAAGSSQNAEHAEDYRGAWGARLHNSDTRPTWTASHFTLPGAASPFLPQVYMLGGSVTAGIGRGTGKAYTEQFFDIINASFSHS